MNEQINKKQELRDKIFNLHDYITMSYYVNQPNVDLGERKANDVVLFSLMTGLLNRNQLVMGNYGLGKTTSAQAVSSLLYNLPMEFVDQGMVQGHPMLTEEKLFGRLDFAKLNETEKVIFSTFAQTPSTKIIDEINRIPEGTQNLLLGAVESGRFKYLNENLRQEKFPFFATANYQDGGNTELTPPLLDRFDVSVEVSYPMFLGNYLRGDFDIQKLSSQKQTQLAKLVSQYESDVLDSDKDLGSLEREYKSELSKILEVPTIHDLKSIICDENLSAQMQDVILDKNLDYRAKMEELTKLSGEFSEKMNGLSLTGRERRSVPALLATQRQSYDAGLLMNVFTDHLNAELKVNGDQQNGHNQKYAIGNVENNISARVNLRSIPEYAKCLSFLKGEQEVSVDTVKQILPYVVNHRLRFTDSYEVDIMDFSNSMQMNKSRQLVEEFIEDDFVKNKEKYRGLYDEGINGGNVDKLLADHRDSDNPLFKRLYQMTQK